MKIVNIIMAWMLAHPVAEHLLEGGIWAGVVALSTYAKSGQDFTIGGAGLAVAVAFKIYCKANRNQAIAFMQDQLQVLANQPGSPAAAVPTPASSALTAVTKIVLFLVGFAFMAGPSFAGYVFTPAKSDKVGLSFPSGTALYLMPIEGFDVGKSLSLPNPTYGLSVNEDFVLAAQTTVNGAPNLAPIFGLGASLYIDLSGPLSNNGPLYLCLGVNALGPDLDLFGMGNGQGLVPQALFIHNFVTNADILTGGLTVFTDLGPGTAVKVSK